MIREAIDAIVNEGRSLGEEEAAAVMEEIMTGVGKDVLRNFLGMASHD